MYRCQKYFNYSAIIVLALTALCKLVSISGESRILGVPDPIFSFLTMRQLLLLTSVIELLAAFYLWKGANPMTKSFVVLWLGAVFFSYRVGLWLMHYKGCACLGTVAQWLPVSPAAVDVLMKVVLAYLTIGSAIFFFRAWFQDKEKKRWGGRMPDEACG